MMNKRSYFIFIALSAFVFLATTDLAESRPKLLKVPLVYKVSERHVHRFDRTFFCDTEDREVNG